MEKRRLPPRQQRLITPAELAEVLRQHVGKFDNTTKEGGGRQWGDLYGVDHGFLSRMCHGLVPIPERIANILGYRKVVSTMYKADYDYEPIDAKIKSTTA